MLELLGPAMSITTAAVLARSSLRAWRAENKLLKWGGTILAAVFSAAVTLIRVIMVVGLVKLHARSAPTLDLKVAGTSEQIARGQAISDGFCSGRHSRAGTLTGRLDLAQDLPVPIGSFVASYGEYILSYQDRRACRGDKLTGGAPGQLAPLGPDLTLVKGWKFEEFVTTMRTGVDPNGRELGKQMSWQPIGRMGDEELRAVYEYLTHMPDA